MMLSSFAIKGHVEFQATNNLDYVVLRHINGSEVTCYLQGATITSYKDKGKELLFVSSKALFAEGKAIRGGIPICFPQFGPGELPQHGFARTALWSVKSTKVLPDNSVEVVLSLTDTEATRKSWNNAFELEYILTLQQDQLALQLKALNKNTDKPFNFTVALHTYFRVSDISSVGIEGLKGITFIDKVRKAEKYEEESMLVRITQETDRVYIRSPATTKINHSSGSHIIQKEGFDDIVIWNPWIEKAKAMADFGDEEYKEMVCAETGQIFSPVTLPAKATWVGKMILKSAL